jgi:hypothetical protein
MRFCAGGISNIFDQALNNMSLCKFYQNNTYLTFLLQSLLKFSFKIFIIYSYVTCVIKCGHNGRAILGKCIPHWREICYSINHENVSYCLQFCCYKHRLENKLFGQLLSVTTSIRPLKGSFLRTGSKIVTTIFFLPRWITLIFQIKFRTQISITLKIFWIY